MTFYRKIDYDALCRFRYFVMYVAQVASAWILVIISVDRWIRTQFPFKANVICTPRNALIALAIILFIDVGLHSHMLTHLFQVLVPGVANGACGPNYFTQLNYFLFYFIEWSFIQVRRLSAISRRTIPFLSAVMCRASRRAWARWPSCCSR